MRDDLEKIRDDIRKSFAHTFPETAGWTLLAASSSGGCQRKYYLEESEALFMTPDGRYFHASKRRYSYYEKSYTDYDDHYEKSIHEVDPERAGDIAASMAHRFEEGV